MDKKKVLVKVSNRTVAHGRYSNVLHPSLLPILPPALPTSLPPSLQIAPLVSLMMVEKVPIPLTT